MAITWKDVWEARHVGTMQGSLLAQLLAADGFDTPASCVSEEAWRNYVSATATRIGITARSSVFDVGCGAGAYVFELYRQGCQVGGLDASSVLIRYAGKVMPQGKWIHADASELASDPPYDFVIASGSFHYFPSLDYAEDIVARMVRKAGCGVMILDVPDLAKRDEAIEHRSLMVGKETYARKYEGLGHLYFERSWFEHVLANHGAARVEIADQRIDGYANAAHRFNVFGWFGSTAENT